MRIKIRFFANLKDRYGPKEVYSICRGSKYSDLFSKILKKHPKLKLDDLNVLVNGRALDMGKKVDTNEIMIFPLIEGG